MSLFSVCIPKMGSLAQHHRPTQRALDRGSLPHFQLFFWLRVYTAPKQGPRPPTCQSPL